MGDGQLQFEVHFGYRDGISQPQIEGVEYPKRKRAASVPMSKPGDFLLGKGYANAFRGNYLYGIPAALGDNATYGVFRKAKQDVFGFEKFLIAAAKSLGIDRELLAAKLMGRWRNGNPLSLTPDNPQPATPILEEDLNNFDYVPTPANPAVFDDSDGLRCPIGSHARRMYPRSQTVVGKSHSRRLIRRSMPYGPRVNPSTVELETPDDGIERGLIGFFICGDIANQFEFIIKAWANHDLATTGILGTLDPVIGPHPDDGGRFLLPGPNGTVVLIGLRRHVHTRGSIYCLIPGIGGLQWLADQ